MRFSKIFYPILITLVLVFVGRNFYHAIQGISLEDLLALKVQNLVLSLLSYLLFISGLGFGWIVIQHKGNPFAHLSALPIYYITAMGKYAPGKIWTAISKERFFTSDQKAGAVGSGFLEIVATTVSGSLIGSFAIFRVLNLPPLIWVALAIMVLGVIIFLPNTTTSFGRWVGRTFLKKELKLQFIGDQFLLALIIDCAAWVIGGLSLVFLLSAFNHHPPLPILDAASIFAASYTLGYIAVFLPAGIGVREQVFAVLLGSNPHAYLLATFLRLISLFGDLFLALSGLVARLKLSAA